MSRTGNVYIKGPNYSYFNRRTVVAIQKEIVKQGKRGPVSSSFHAKGDKELITAWERELDRVFHIFNVSAAGPS